MISLTNVTIHKYKSFESDQSFEIDKDITVLVGMNESGKTSALEVLAKTNYFDGDPHFKFNATHDFPRKEKKAMDKSGENPNAVTCTFEISDELLKTIQEDVGKDTFKQKTYTKSYNYKNSWSISFTANWENFVAFKTKEIGIASEALNTKLNKINSVEQLDEIINEFQDDKKKEGLEKLKKYVENTHGWENAIKSYIQNTYLKNNEPRYLYYDEYYSLPSRISIEELEEEELELEELKTAKALFELADINVNELTEADDFENFKAELEATQATITDELFEYWSTNNNLDIQFDIDKREKTDTDGNRRIVEHILDIRVYNSRARVSLPLEKRSKGFNWFFSFLVWFKKIQEDKNANYIILMDEPGLNLHAAAQKDLMRFIEKLSEEYQIVYTTHSPFMVDPQHLERVRTVLETDNGSTISDSIQEKDPNTLFPLQAALGYDIAQNLYVSKNNLLVEGVSDLIYLQIMSSLLQQENRQGLRADISIVPVGGMEKVATFVSLLRGSDLDIACLLDSSIDTGSKAKINNLIKEKIIHQKKILFFDDFIDNYSEADIEDMFSKAEYLNFFNAAFNEHKDISEKDLKTEISRIVVQINHHLGIDRYNHYRPANQLAKTGVKVTDFSKETLDRFEEMFKVINSKFDAVTEAKAA